MRGLLISCTFAEAERARKSICVIALATTFRQPVKVFDVATTEDRVIGFERGNQVMNRVCDVVLPFAFPPSLQAPLTNVVFVVGLLVAKTTQLLPFPLFNNWPTCSNLALAIQVGSGDVIRILLHLRG